MNDGGPRNTLLKRVHVTCFNQGVSPREVKRGRDLNGREKQGERGKGLEKEFIFFVPSPPSFSPAMQTDHTFYVARLSLVRAFPVVCGSFKVDSHCRVILTCVRT